MLGFCKFILLCITCWLVSIPTQNGLTIPIIFGGYIFLTGLRDGYGLWKEMANNHRYVITKNPHRGSIDTWGYDYYDYNTPSTHTLVTSNIPTSTEYTPSKRKKRSVFSYGENTAQDIFKELSKTNNVQSCELVSEPKTIIPWRRTKTKYVEVPRKTTVEEETTQPKPVSKEYIMLENTPELSETKDKVYKAIIEELNKLKISPTERYTLLQAIPNVDIYQGTVIVYIDKPLLGTQNIKEEWINKGSIENSIKTKLGTSLVEVTFADVHTPSLLNYYFTEHAKA